MFTKVFMGLMIPTLQMPLVTFTSLGEILLAQVGTGA